MEKQIINELAVFTKMGSPFGFGLLETLALRGVKPRVLIIEKVDLKKRYKLAKNLARKIGIIDTLRYNYGFLKGAFSGSTADISGKYNGYAGKIFFVDNINSTEVENIVYQEKISRITLAHASIIRSPRLLNEEIWMINAHPGWLPKMRGVDVVKWALFFREKIGITLHIVSSNIDCGRILLQQEVQLEQNDTIASLEKRMMKISIDILADASVNGPDSYSEQLIQKMEDGIQLYLMPFAIKKQLEQNFEKIKQYYLNGRS